MASTTSSNSKKVLQVDTSTKPSILPRLASMGSISPPADNVADGDIPANNQANNQMNNQVDNQADNRTNNQADNRTNNHTDIWANKKTKTVKVPCPVPDSF